MDDKCAICNKDAHSNIVVRGHGLDGESVALCESDFKTLVNDINTNDSCVFCNNPPSKELQISHRDIGDYERGKRPHIMRLCNKHLESIT